MNERQSHELQELLTLEAAGTLEDSQKVRLEDLKALKIAFENSSKYENDFKTAQAQKEHFRSKFESEEAARKAAEEKLKTNPPAPKPGDDGSKGLGVQDFIDISASLEGLDQTEKAYVANLHKMTGKPLPEIRKDENFLLWQSAYRAKVEKEKQNIPPANKHPDDNTPVSLEEALKGASLEDQEKLLAETIGYSVGRKSKSERVKIG